MYEEAWVLSDAHPELSNCPRPFDHRASFRSYSSTRFVFVVVFVFLPSYFFTINRYQ